MADKIYLKAHFGFRSDTLENWETVNPVLEKGELSIVSDGKNGQFMKIGNGETLWSELPYVEFNTSTDSEYDSTSANAQSGIAVAQAISEALAQTKKITSVTLYANQWVGAASPYSQVVTIAEATANSKIDLNPTVEQLNIFYNKDIAFVVGNNNGIITVYCIGQKPTNDYIMQATITEVAING